MSGRNQLFIQWHGGLSTTLTAAEVALRLRTSMDVCLMYILFLHANQTLTKPNPSCLSAKQPLAQPPSVAFKTHSKQTIDLLHCGIYNSLNDYNSELISCMWQQYSYDMSNTLKCHIQLIMWHLTSDMSHITCKIKIVLEIPPCQHFINHILTILHSEQSIAK